MDIPQSPTDIVGQGAMLALQTFAGISIVYNANVEHARDALTFIDHETGAVVDVPTLLHAGATPSAIRYFR